MQSKTYYVLLIFLFFFLFQNYPAHAEPEEVAHFGKWYVYSEKSIIDGSINSAYCVSQSENRLSSNTAVKWAVLFVKMSKNNNGTTSTYIYVKFPESHSRGSSAKVKLSENISTDWAVTDNYAVFRNKTDPFEYIKLASDSKEMLVETKDKNGRIQYQAVFDMDGLIPAFMKLMTFFMH